MKCNWSNPRQKGFSGIPHVIKQSLFLCVLARLAAEYLNKESNRLTPRDRQLQLVWMPIFRTKDHTGDKRLQQLPNGSTGVVAKLEILDDMKEWLFRKIFQTETGNLDPLKFVVSNTSKLDIKVSQNTAFCQMLLLLRITKNKPGGKENAQST